MTELTGLFPHPDSSHTKTRRGIPAVLPLRSLYHLLSLLHSIPEGTSKYPSLRKYSRYPPIYSMSISFHTNPVFSKNHTVNSFLMRILLSYTSLPCPSMSFWNASKIYSLPLSSRVRRRVSWNARRPPPPSVSQARAPPPGTRRNKWDGCCSDGTPTACPHTVQSSQFLLPLGLPGRIRHTAAPGNPGTGRTPGQLSPLSGTHSAGNWAGTYNPMHGWSDCPHEPLRQTFLSDVTGNR